MQDKTWDLVSKLAKRTEEGRLRWARTADEGRFTSSFPDYSIAVSRGHEGDVTVELLNQSGDPLDEFTDSEFKDKFGYSAKRTMLELWQNARRNAMGTAAALDKLLSELGDDDEIMPF